MKNNSRYIAALALLIGFGFGYLVWGGSSNEQFRPGMMHQMSDGIMMGGDGHMNMNEMMTNMMGALNNKTGDEFDKAFLSEMIVHHQGAVVMAEAVLRTSKRAELRKLASDIISAQTTEINLMKNWQKSWFNQ